MLEYFEAEANQHNLPFLTLSETRFRVPLEYGQVELTSGENTLEIHICAQSQEALYLIKESIEEHLVARFPELASMLKWHGQLSETAYPPNFCEMRLISKQDIADQYIRLTVTGKGIERFFAESMHFRLVYPKLAGQVPLWPQINSEGRTIWPDGDDELLRPVYTVRQFDMQAQTLDFDVFLHDGGRTTDWAKGVGIGAKVGLLGPSGGGVPEADFMLLAGDETAIPAICRVLDSAPSHARGVVLFSIQEGRSKDIPLLLPQGFEVQWLERHDHDYGVLFEAAKEIQFPNSVNSYLWLAGDKKTAQVAKTYFRGEQGFTPQNSYIAAFW